MELGLTVVLEMIVVALETIVIEMVELVEAQVTTRTRTMQHRMTKVTKAMTQVEKPTKEMMGLLWVLVLVFGRPQERTMTRRTTTRRAMTRRTMTRRTMAQVVMAMEAKMTNLLARVELHGWLQEWCAATCINSSRPLLKRATSFVASCHRTRFCSQA